MRPTTKSIIQARINGRYRLGMAVVAAFALVSLILSASLSVSFGGAGKAIRDDLRVNAMHAALLAVEAARLPDAPARAVSRQTIEDLAAELQSAHAVVLSRRTPHLLTLPLPAELEQLYFDGEDALGLRLERYRDHLRAFAADLERSDLVWVQLDAKARLIAGEAQKLLPDLERAVKLDAKELESGLRSVFAIQTALLVATLGVLIAVVRYVLKPLVATIGALIDAAELPR